jgi:hypothetical protein
MNIKCFASASCWVIVGLISALQSPAFAESDVIKESLSTIPSNKEVTSVAAEGTFPAIAPTVQWNNKETGIDSTIRFMVIDNDAHFSLQNSLFKQKLTHYRPEQGISLQEFRAIKGESNGSARDLILGQASQPEETVPDQTEPAVELNPDPDEWDETEEVDPKPTPRQLVRKVVTDVDSLNIQNWTYLGRKPSDLTGDLIRITSINPIRLSEDLVLQARTTFPLINQSGSPQAGGDIFGLGDIVTQFYFIPCSTGNFAWAAGPMISFPTATEKPLGFDKWGIGPTVEGIFKTGRWVIGGRINNLWFVVGDASKPDAVILTIQPFINYILSDGWYLTSSPVIQGIWYAGFEQWIVPIGGGGGKVFAIGDQKIDAHVQFFWHADKPANAPDWTFRLNLTFFFPRGG